MTGTNKKAVNAVLDKLHTEGSTNLWDGLQTGMEIIRENYDEMRNQSVFIFTDGMPNIIPPRGHLPMLKKYQESNPNIQMMINTFGFGYSMDSLLLNEIAQQGNGFYTYIPDSGLVGTVFVNALSNVVSMCAKNIKVTFSTENGVKFADG